MELTENQKKVLDFLKGTKANITEIAEGTGIAQPHVSKIVGQLKDMEVLETETVGNQKIVNITEGVTVTDEEAIVPAGELPFYDKCLKAFQRFFRTKKERKNIDVLMEMIKQSRYNQTPQGIDRLLGDYGIDASRSRLILQYIFGSELEQQQPAYAPYTPGARPRSFVQPGQQTQPVSIQPGGAAFIPPTLPGGGAYIISLGREGGQQQPPVYGPGERIIRREVSMRTRRRPILDDSGKPMKDPDTGEILYELVEEPVVLGTPQQQVDVFKLTEHIFGLVKKARDEAGGTPPSVDTREIADQVKEGLQGDLDRISDSTESVKERMDTIERELEIERRVKARVGPRPQAQPLSDKQFELTQQRELIEKTVAPDLRGMRKDLKDVFLLQVVSKIEEQRGLQPGTLLTPIVNRIGITEGVTVSEEGVTEAEKKQLLARARAAGA